MLDGNLIRLAQGGDRDAFGELVRRHRAKAFDWARSLARDPHLAEDIVQEALLRAFMHLGTLAELDRFLPWLHRIVRNEALMKLRKGENSGKERTFTRISAAEGLKGSANWSDLECILHYLCGKRDPAEADTNPSIRLDQKEFLETMRQLLRCLSGRERAVFEAHFFNQLSPVEISRLFQTTTDNVYQSLSRARHKVQEERKRVRLQDYVHERRDVDVSERVVLALKKGPHSGEWKRCKTSFAGAVYAVLPFTSRQDYSLVDVMGLTSQAFRLTVQEDTIDATGPTMYFWESRFREGLLNLGLESEHSGDGGAPPTAFMLNKGIKQIRHSISRGIPVIAWDLFTPEFGLIYGYDDAEQILYAQDAKAKKELPYDQFGRGISGGLFVLAITAEVPIPYWYAVRNALEVAIRHAYGEMTFTRYACGLAAFECWKDALMRRTVDPLGNAYTAAIAADARLHAAAFLRGIEQKLVIDGQEEASFIARESAIRYEAVAAALNLFTRLFPFPSGGLPNDESKGAAGIALLESAMLEEKKGVQLLGRLNSYLGLIVDN